MPKATNIPKPRSLTRVIAVRRLRVPGPPSRAVTVRIGAPRRLSGGWDWGCPVAISGLGKPRLRYVFGVDAFQALHLTLDYIAGTIAATVPRPYWFDKTDGSGFTRSVPSLLPLVTQQKLNAAIDRAIISWSRQEKRVARSRRKTRH